MLFSRANLTVLILPSKPRSPNPGATKIPSKSANCFSASNSAMFSAFIQDRFTLHSFTELACINASLIDLYASGSSTYLPIKAIFTSTVGF